MKLNPREQILISVIRAMVLLGGSWLFGGTLWGRWRELQRTVTAKQRELAGMEAAIRSKPEWQREAGQLREGLGPQKPLEQMSDLLKRLDQAGATAGVQISARRPAPVVDHGTYRELPVQCSFDATTESLVRFLYTLQTGEGLVSIEQLQVAGRPDNPSLLRCELHLRALGGRGGKATP